MKKVKALPGQRFWEDVLGMLQLACQIGFLPRVRSRSGRIESWQVTSGIPTHQFPKSRQGRALLFVQVDVFFDIATYQHYQISVIWYSNSKIGNP